MEGVSIESCVEADREHVIAVLARAFRDNPLERAVIGRGRERRLRSITHAMRSGVGAALAGDCRTLVARLDGDLAGALLAIPPDGFPLPPPPLFPHLRSLLGQGLRVARRWAEVYELLEGVHPGPAHWYLSLLGVDPPYKRRGIGSALLRSWLDSIEKDGLPSYLETDREENILFYERVGFRVEVELNVLDTGIWCMRRPPSATHAED
jgi:ribosomal protein S18 acetylase RimI-like enzyme